MASTSYKRIPIRVAQDIARHFDKDQVIVVTWDKTHGRTHVVTFGKTLAECFHQIAGQLVGCAIEKPDNRHGFLRKRGNRPNGRATE